MAGNWHRTECRFGSNGSPSVARGVVR